MHWDHSYVEKTHGSLLSGSQRPPQKINKWINACRLRYYFKYEHIDLGECDNNDKEWKWERVNLKE